MIYDNFLNFASCVRFYMVSLFDKVNAEVFMTISNDKQSITLPQFVAK